MIRRPPRSTQSRSSAASDVYKRQVYKDGDTFAGINPAEEGSPFCVWVRPDQDGLYYLTATTAAPHVTEHNDLWIQAPGVGLFRYKRGSIKQIPNKKFLKGYQNEGADKKAKYLLNVDHNGHQFITPNLTKGQRYKICISGRSTQYKVFNICLLYTSPSPRDLSTSRMPSSA